MLVRSVTLHLSGSAQLAPTSSRRLTESSSDFVDAHLEPSGW